MEFALTADHRRIHALDAEKGQGYYCPVCGNQVIPRQGEVNSWHFAHVTSCVDDWKYDMSEWHRSWQNRFPESTREVVIEYKGESHRADILTGGYVIEFQHSPITSTEFERRNLFYTKAGYKVIWVFDETEAYANEYIIGSGDNCDKFVWKWPNRAIASVVPQFTSDVAIIFQLIEEDDENDCDWLVKAEWAIAEDDTYADYRRFFIDDGFTPDLFSPTGLRDIMLNKRRRFEAFLRDHSPYEPKCKRMKGNPRSWYESVRPTDNTGHLIWSALGPKTLELVQQNVTAIGISGNVEVLETDADLIEQLIKGATGDPQKLSKKIQINLEAIIRGVIDDPVFVELGERLEKLKEEHEKGLMTSVIFLKKLLELARDTVAAVKKANATQPEPTREEKGKAALTELFKEARNAKTPVIVERIVDEIDGIVRIVRFPGWQDTETGRREISMELYGIFARKKLFDKDLVEKAYKYVEQYY